MKNKVLGVRTLSGEVFYGTVNKDGCVSEKVIDFPNEQFENAMLMYLSYLDRTDNFKKPYIIDLPIYKNKFKIIVEEIKRERNNE